MTGTIFAEALRRNWKAGLAWAIGLGLLAFFVILLMGDAAFVESMGAMLDMMPPAILQVFGADNAAALATTEGFVSAIFFTYAGLVMAVYGLLTGMAISANEEESGILDFVLSLPVSRTRLIVERIAAHVVISIGIVLFIFVALFSGTLITGIDIDRGRLLIGSINMLPMTLFMIALSAFAAAALRRRSTALGIVSAYIIASYFISFIAGAMTSAITDAISYSSVFTYYASERVAQQGLIPLFIFILLLAFGLFLLAALRYFERRDIAV